MSTVLFPGDIVGVSAHGGVAALAKGTTIHGERRLALNADRPTEYDNIAWKEHLPTILKLIKTLNNY